MKRTLSLTVEENIYQEVKNTIPVGGVSPLVNNLLKEYLKKQREQKLITAYQRIAKNKNLQSELALWSSISGDGLNDK